MFCSFLEKENIELVSTSFLYAISSREKFSVRNLSIQDIKHPLIIEVNKKTGQVFLTEGEEFLSLFNQYNITYCPAVVKITENKKGFFTPINKKDFSLDAYVKPSDVFLFNFNK